MATCWPILLLDLEANSDQIGDQCDCHGNKIDDDDVDYVDDDDDDNQKSHPALVI